MQIGYPGAYPNYAAQQARYVEVIPVDSEEEVERAAVAVGGTGLFAARNNRFLAVKSVELNGEPTTDYYDLRPPAPKPKPFDPKEYIRRDEIMDILADILNRKEEAHEPV